MKRVLCLLFVLLLLLPTAFSLTGKYAVYEIKVSSQTKTFSLQVNETVLPTRNQSFSDLILSLTDTSWNLTYSRIVNSSHQFFPYVHAIANQTFNFSRGHFSITFSLVKNGTKQLNFQGSTYTITTYSLVAIVSGMNKTKEARGAIESFPSGLLYLASLSTGSFSASVILVSTNLQLNGPSSTAAEQTASMAIGAGAALAAIAGSLGYRQYRRKVIQKDNPEHYVD